MTRPARPLVNPPGGGFRAQLRAAFRAVLADKGVLLITLLAPLLYGFFYPWPYSTQAVQRVPVAVVDLDGSSLSRQLTRFAQAAPQLDVRLVTPHPEAARQALWRGQVQGIATWPAHLKRDVARGAAVTVPVEGNGAYPLIAKTVLTGFMGAVGTVSAGIEIRRLQAAGLPPAQAAAARAPLGLHDAPLFNPTQGYGSYVVPAVAWLIAQQTLLIGAAMLAGRWRERGTLGASARGWAGRIAGLALWGLASGAFYLGWVMVLQGYPRGANLAGALLLLVLYAPAVAALGLLLGVLLKDRERAMYVLLASTLPMAFVSGAFWPSEALPAALRALAQLLPSTAGMQAGVQLAQMGARLLDAAPSLAALAGITLACLAALAWRAPPPDGATPRRPGPGGA
ncbi:MAG: ABC transporter permease [Comamonadaceae bacterium]|nr:ABC transporter permease [Comamonadaceae bacterium]